MITLKRFRTVSWSFSGRYHKGMASTRDSPANDVLEAIPAGHLLNSQTFKDDTRHPGERLRVFLEHKDQRAIFIMRFTSLHHRLRFVAL